MSQYSVVIRIAAPGSPLADGDTSDAGHMWFELNRPDGIVESFGFDSGWDKPLPAGPGNVSKTDSNHYLQSSASPDFSITEQQYNQIKNYVSMVDAGQHGWYIAPTNSCVDFTWQALGQAGIGQRIAPDGDLFPTWNFPLVNSAYQQWQNDPGNPDNSGSGDGGSGDGGSGDGGSGNGGLDPFNDGGWMDAGAGQFDPFNGAGSARWDPLVLDLDGDGIETTDTSAGAFFDLDNNGFAERSGWVKPDDGILVMDRNGDGIINGGQELFGDQTILTNGQRATDGFQALADLDTNGDEKIDANDADYANIRVWKDMNGDGYSNAEELFTLGDLGIQSLSIRSTSTNTTDANGNTQVSLGSFERQDGTVQSIGQYLFDRDPIYSIATDWIDVPQDIMVLPYLKGHGNVYDLWQAMARDESGALKALVESFSAEEDFEIRGNIMDQLLFKWTNSDTINPASSGGNMDARQLSVLEKMFGEQFSGLITTIGTTNDPNVNAAAILKDIYIDVKEYYYVRLMAQTHTTGLLDAINYTWNSTTNTYIDDLTCARNQIDEDFAQSYDKGLEEISEFSRVLQGLGLKTMLTSFDDFRNYFANTYGTDVGQAIDMAGKGLHSIISGGEGDDVLLGGVSSNTLYGNKGNDTINGGAGDDNLFGQDGNDILDGGSGNDYLEGGAGNDVYQYGIGSGNDLICNYGSSGEYDIVQFTSGLTSDMLAYRQNGNDLLLIIQSTGETLTINNFFSGEEYLIDKLVFADGSELMAAQLSEIATVQGTLNSDTLYGSDGHNDKIYGLDGNDTIYGYQGNDTMDGGTGNDYLEGGAGDDTYIWGRGVGNDTINNSVYTGSSSNPTYVDSGNDTVQLGNGITVESVEWLQNGETLTMRIKDSGETLTFDRWFLDDSFKVKTVQFADGTELTAAQISNLAVILSTDGADVLKGSNNRNDILNGRAGNDYLEGGAGDDTYIWGRGVGNDTINNSVYTGSSSNPTYVDSGNDRVQLGEGITVDSVEWLQNGETLTMKIKDSGETLTFDRWFLDDSFKVKTVQFADGTELTAAQISNLAVILSTDASDILIGSSKRNDVMNGGAGDDTLDGRGGADIMTGGLGNDTYIIDNIGDVVTELSGEGSDTVKSSISYTLGANLENLILTGAMAIDATGNEIDNTLTGNSSSNVLNGGLGNDTLQGGDGADTYIFDASFGQDVIKEGVSNSTISDNDSIVFGSGLTSDKAILSRDGDDLIIGFQGSTDQVTIKGQFSHDGWFLGWKDIETIRFADGVEWTDAQVRAMLIQQSETAGDDTVTGYWTADTLDGGAGNDTLIGLGGGDTYLFGKGSGQDVIKESIVTIYEDQPDTVSFLPNVAISDVTFHRVNNDLQISIAGVNDTLTVKNQFGLSYNAVELFQFADGTSLTAAQIASSIFESQSTSGDDLIVGTDGVDVMNGGLGNDTLQGGDGADTYIFDAGFGQDVIKESVSNLTISDNDSVVFGSGLTSDKAILSRGGDDLMIGFLGSTDQVTIKGQFSHDAWFQGWKDIETIRFADGIEWTDAQVRTMLIQQSETAGDDTVTGYWTADTLDGGAGDDTLVGLGGGDTYLFGKGSGQDVIKESIFTIAEDQPDTISFRSDVTRSDVTFLIVGNDLKISIAGAADTLTVKNHFGSSDNAVELFQFADGTMLTAADVAILAVAAQTTGGDDLVTGTLGADTLYGGAGNDTLDGGLGSDTMSGGIGNDVYVVESSGDVVIENTEEGIDTVHSSITYTLGANLENLMLTGYSSINGTGNELDNVITGTSYNNVLTGGAGNDTLDGGLGSDTMIGGTGNDSYVVDNSGDVVTENAGEGTDMVQSSISYTLGANLEGLTLTDSATKATGNSLDNVLIGNGLSNILDGGAGADTMTGGLGNDTYVVDSAGDVVIENAVEGTDTVQVGFSYTLGANVENLTLSGTNNITGIGNALNNVLIGNSGDNMLDGGAGNDNMTGGFGNDIFIVDSIGDVVNENIGEGIDTVQSGVTFTVSANVENLTLTGTNSINGTGNTLSNMLTGNSGDNVLDGGSGADALAGGLGNDTYIVDNVGDTVNENAGEGIDTVKSSVSYVLSSNVENLTLTGNSNINGTGNELDNVLTGNSYNNSLSGGAGNDTLDGGGGIDTMVGGAGNDIYVVDSTGDKVTENAGEGIDTIQSSITYTLGVNLENVMLTGSGNINGTGNTFDNLLIGNSGNNVLDGCTGADTMAGGLGNDTYVVDNAGDVVTENAGEGVDAVQSSVSYVLGANLEKLTLTGTTAINGTGNEMDNIIAGNSVNNILYGGLGNDIIDGGAGADTMTGGLGNDTYVVDNTSDVVAENAEEGVDAVQSSISYVLGANLENLTLTGSSSINGTGNELDNILTGNSYDNVLEGGIGNDTMTGGTGNDTYIVDSIGDIVIENTGQGSDTVKSSVTYVLGVNLENLTLTGTDAINGTGNELDNIITGNSVNNILNGGLGNDTLHGDAGDDSMTGGLGDDTYIVDSTGDVVTENAGEGSDTVKSSVTYVLGANLEKLTLTGTAVIDGTGNQLDNTITGNSVNNILSGGLGNDILDGGAGADMMTGGLGNDIYVVDNTGDVVTENAGEGVDAVQSSITYVLGANLENLTLIGSSMVNGTGNALDNVLTGNTSWNVLNGGSGADTMIGGQGWDTYVVDNLGDVVIEYASGETDTVNSSISYILGANLENLTLTGAIAINGTGNELDNTITGNSLANIIDGGLGNDTLDGGTGADMMTGGLGNDTYMVDNTGDVVTESASEGIDTVKSSISYVLGVNLENLTLTGFSNLNGTGNELDNVIMGNSVNNVLIGGLGNDTLDGYGGTDTFIGGLGDDTYFINSTGDVVTENAGEGTDTVKSSITYTLGSNLENLTLTEYSNINGAGNELDNILTGNSYNNMLTGGAGSDVLNGGSGNDILDGGAGNDTLRGGLGNDTYLFGVGSGNETINSYESADNGLDTLQFQNLVLASIEFTRGNNDLVCTITQTGETVRLSNWTLGTSYQVDQFQFSDGTLTADQVNQKIA
ncbi:beta strand repeat-containing protein [Sporomusa malonica]|uniref:Ca2+-binding protein, RTX toxin-related n=1 Tax=Sporomusa malonica TaxID=112901 RepID=A0A1W1ZDN1_9FIRM|nr:calcium-binding protein [Sporomusa malonica]SMC46565.1 Ca2+-binding protein, RTX toxin-related [Sporomusa malonica]